MQGKKDRHERKETDKGRIDRCEEGKKGREERDTRKKHRKDAKVGETERG
jgi:hypothetical protein